MEIIAEDMDELKKKIVSTMTSLFGDPEFCQKVDNKKIVSDFFTEYATISTIE